MSTKAIDALIDAIATWSDLLAIACGADLDGLLRFGRTVSVPDAVRRFVDAAPKEFTARLRQDQLDRLRRVEQVVAECTVVIERRLPHIELAMVGEHESVFALLKDMVADRSLSKADRAACIEFVGVSFWRSVRECVTTLQQLVTEADLAASNGEQLHQDPVLDQAAIEGAFLQMYREQFTEVHGDDLNKIREDDNFKAEHVANLIDMIDAGASLYSLDEKDLALKSRRQVVGKATPFANTVVNQCAIEYELPSSQPLGSVAE